MGESSAYDNNNCKTCQEIKAKIDEPSCSSSDFEEISDHSNNNINKEILQINLQQTTQQNKKQQNKTFSNEKIREIECRNSMLVQKILYHNRRPNQYKTVKNYAPKITSSEINRRKHQEKIIRENEILLKKIQTVKPAVRRYNNFKNY